MSVIWGVPYLLIKVAVRSLDPATLVFARTGIATGVLLPVAVSRSALRPVLSRWRPLLAYTLCELGVPWVLLASAERRLPSSLSGLLVAAVPLAGAGLTSLAGHGDRLRPTAVAGLVVGMVGVAVLVGFDVSSTEVSSALLVAVVVVGYATGPIVLSRSLGDLPVLGVVTLSLALCTAGYAPFALTHLPADAVPVRALAAVIVLATVCTALAFLLFFALIVEMGPVRATVITYVNPAVAVALGAVFLHEPTTGATVFGFVLILAGSALATRATRDPPPDFASPS